MTRAGLRLSLLALLAVAACEAADRRPGASDARHHDVGPIGRTVTTSSRAAQRWFDRGLGLAYGFNHAEAVFCFEQALAADPSCAMAYWGKAYALGPNYNDPAPAPESMRAAHEAVRRGLAAIDDETPAERALLKALQVRYAWPLPDDRKALDNAYANTMRRVLAAHPDDADIHALTAEAVMQLRPWKLWSPAGEPAPEIPEIRSILEAGLASWPNHAALCHLYIHAMEAGPDVARALPAARALESLDHGLGHLHHMPSHIYVWTGQYDDVIRTNVEACAVDEHFVAHRGRNNFFTAYRLHNLHFVAYGAMWDGRRALALEYARRIPGEIPPELMKAAPDLFDVFAATPYHVLVRFGMWDEMLREPEPAADELHATRAVWRYARAVAYASLGRVKEAEREQAAFRGARAAVPKSRILFNNPVHEILDVAEDFLAGEIEYRKGNHDRAFALLRQAVEHDEQLNYDEPWGWMEPARHALGALLTEQRRFAEAEQVYRANLKRYPENGWALHGLAECLEGQRRGDEAAAVRKRFAKAWARADVQIPGSCFCKGVKTAR